MLFFPSVARKEIEKRIEKETGFLFGTDGDNVTVVGKVVQIVSHMIPNKNNTFAAYSFQTLYTVW